MKYMKSFAVAVFVGLMGMQSLWWATSHRPSPAATTPKTAAPAVVLPKASGPQALALLHQHKLYDSLAAAYQAARYRPVPVGGVPTPVASDTLYAPNPAKGFLTYFAGDSIQIQPSRTGESPCRWSARVTGYGRGNALQPPAPAKPVAVDSRVEYRRGSITEWYENGPRGLEQGFTLTEAPPGSDAGGRAGPSGSAAAAPAERGPLTVALSFDTDLAPRLNKQADGVTFVDDAGQPVVQYAGLKAWDATGRALPARMQLAEAGGLALIVDDANAQYPLTIDPLILFQTRLANPNPHPGLNDLFGDAVAIDGSTVVVGNPIDIPEGPSFPGSVYVFVLSNSGWSLQQTLTASDGQAHDGFAYHLAISGNTVVVLRSGGLIPGSAVYVFERSGNVWSQQAELTPNNMGNFYDVAISGDTVVVGAPLTFVNDFDDAGVVYVFVRGLPSVLAPALAGSAPIVGTAKVWNLQAKLTASDPATFADFGSAVGIDGDTLVVGATGQNNDAGAAYVFVRSGTVWSQPAEITGSDTVASDVFGLSVSVSGDTVVVGAPNAGAAYVFVPMNGIWSQEAKLTASDATSSDGFGNAVAISGDYAVVGAYGENNQTGAAYLFGRSGSTWSQQGKLTASGTTADFGLSVAISGNHIVVSAPFEDSRNGAVYVFRTFNRLLVGPGFWVNNLVNAPDDVLTMGSQTYTQGEVLTLLNMPVGGGPKADASLILAKQLIAAKLNISSGSDAKPVAAIIADADSLLGGFEGKLPYSVRPSSAMGQSLLNDADMLDRYNSGKLKTPPPGTLQ
jgi:hypothetical protein